MIRISANTLEEAYTKASKELESSIVDLDIEVLQNPSSGFLGLFSKPAIIKASIKGSKQDENSAKIVMKKHIISDDNTQKESNKVKYKIKEGINKLLDASCFDVQLVELKIDEEIAHIKLDGEDVALLIGKEGYRYKALSYILHNWIKIKYNLNISLEIAQFLKNQEEMIDNYLLQIRDKIDQNGRAQTKPLDGILVKIALGKLRERYPQKYVAIRTLRDGRKIVIINEFKKANS